MTQSAPEPGDLPLSPDQARVVALLDAEPPGLIRSCFRSALDHLRRAHLLVKIDPAMAIFRGITAEEEAATGLMRALVERQYPRADELKPHVHLHKHAVLPFIRAVLTHRKDLKFPDIESVRLGFKEVDGRTRIVVALLPSPPTGFYAHANPPLNLRMWQGEDYSIPDFKKDFERLIAPAGYTNIRRFVKEEANRRNRLLYAGPDGYPVVDSLDPRFLLEMQRRVLLILTATLLIWPYDEVQPFVADALAAFLKLVGRLRDEGDPTGGG